MYFLTINRLINPLISVALLLLLEGRRFYRRSRNLFSFGGGCYNFCSFINSFILFTETVFFRVRK